MNDFPTSTLIAQDPNSGNDAQASRSMCFSTDVGAYECALHLKASAYTSTQHCRPSGFPLRGVHSGAAKRRGGVAMDARWRLKCIELGTSGRGRDDNNRCCYSALGDANARISTRHLVQVQCHAGRGARTSKLLPQLLWQLDP